MIHFLSHFFDYLTTLHLHLEQSAVEKYPAEQFFFIVFDFGQFISFVDLIDDFLSKRLNLNVFIFGI